MEALPTKFIERESKNRVIIEKTKKKTPISLTSRKEEDKIRAYSLHSFAIEQNITI
jgi:hypothetical protein